MLCQEICAVKKANAHTPEWIHAIIHLLRHATEGATELASAQIVKRYGQDPYMVLTSCLLSLRTRDTVSLPASIRLFELAQTPQDMLKVPLTTLEKAIYPVGFYHVKARLLHSVSRELLDRFNGQVPSTLEELLSIKGVGLKTASLVLSEGFDIPALCVDTHVHRLSNRLGVVRTKTPDQTEKALRAVMPQKDWRTWTRLLVKWGQSGCKPVLERCSECPSIQMCDWFNAVGCR